MSTLVDTTFMCIAASTLTGPEGKSFEEVRIEDYLKSYSAIGRAPAPCPQQPTNAAQREALGLPPLFQPYKESSLSTTKAPAAKEASPPPPTITNPADLPDAQAFLAPSAYGDPFQVQSISCTPGYSAFSHEELRYYAYLKGHIQSPTPVPMCPFVPAIAEPAPLMTSPTGVRVAVVALPQEETLVSMCTKPEYARHSPEEHRISFLRTGRELTSEEIIKLQPPALLAGSSVSAPTSGVGRGSAFAVPPAVRPFSF